MIFHLNQHLVRVTDIERSFTENDNYTCPSLEIYYINIDTQQSLTKILTPLSPYWNFFLKNEKSSNLKLGQLNPQSTSITTLFIQPETFKMGNCSSFRIVFPLQNSSRPPNVEYRDEYPICLRITSCWKKLQPFDGDQPPHLVCRINLFRHHRLQN